MALEEDFRVVSDEYNEMKRKFTDPVFIGSMLSRVAEEKTSFNLVLKEINAKLDRLVELEDRISKIESKLEKIDANAGKSRQIQATQQDSGRNFISEVDAEILKFVSHKGACTADEVQRKFKYKGANGASARLNNLFKGGLLDKRQAGKKVVFFPKS